MALLTQRIGIDRERVAVQCRMILILRRALLHMATDALIRYEERMRRGLILRRARRQLADIAKQDVVLRRVMWRSAGVGPGGTARVLALAGAVNVGFVLAC